MITRDMTKANTEIQESAEYAPEWNDVIPKVTTLLKSNNGGLAAILPLRIQQGSTFLKRFTIQKPNGDKMDLDNWLVRAAVRESVGSSAVIGGITVQAKDYTFIEGTGRVRSYGSAAGYFDLLLLASETDTMDFDSGVWDLELVIVDLTAITIGGGFTNLNIDVDSGGAGVVTANGGTPFSGVVIGDIIRLSNCADSVNDGVYIVAARSNTALTFTKKIGFGFGVDQATNGAVALQILDPNNDFVIRLYSGTARLDKATTR